MNYFLSPLTKVPARPLSPLAKGRYRGVDY